MASKSKMDRKRTQDDEDFFMIRAKGQFLKVPKELKNEYNAIPSGADHVKKPKKRKKIVSRKLKRKNLRSEKKSKKNEFFHIKNRSSETQVQNNKTIPVSQSDESTNANQPDTVKQKNKTKKRKRKNSAPSERQVDIQRLKQENEKEEKEIQKLEKLLNMNNKKKLPSQSDGLDYLLEVCDPQRFSIGNKSDSEEESGLQKYKQAFSRNQKGKDKTKMERKEINEVRENTSMDEDCDVNISVESENDITDDEDDHVDSTDDHHGMTENARNNTNGVDDDRVNENSNEISTNDDDYENSDDDGDDNGDDDNENSDDNDDGDDTDYDDDDDDDTGKGKDIKDEASKYIPPHLRKQTTSDSKKEHLIRIKRQLKGLLNKLSEGNLQHVCNEIEELFNHNSRNDMNELLTNLILESCVSPALMPNKLLMEHSLVLAVLNCNIGMEIGAYFTQTLAIQFDGLYKAGKSQSNGKEIFNVVSLFSHLYNFKVIHCRLIYDIIRLLSDGFTEQDIDLLLLVLKSTGAEIRRDDPGSLKDIILQIQAKAASASDLSNESRVRFMLEIISNLRNNNLRKIPGYDPSQVEHLRKLLRSVVRDCSQTSTSQLQISLQDLLQADTKGRWWIVGSAWSGREAESIVTPSQQWNSQLLELARKQRMNTDVRKNVFCVMMTSEDFVDAFEKLLKLKLKDVQAREIVHVLVDCCLKEKAYNPYYAYLGQKFCDYNRSYQVTFQYSFWDKFKMIDSLTTSSAQNMCLLLGHLIASKTLSLSILKAVNFMELDKPSIKFFKRFLSHLLTEYPAEVSRKSFERIASSPNLALLRQGMALFMRHFMGKSGKSDGISQDRVHDVIELLQSSEGSRLA